MATILYRYLRRQEHSAICIVIAARLICAAPPLLKVAQKLLLWMEEMMPAFEFSAKDDELYHELRQVIRTAGGFSSDTWWWQGPCICDACGHAWQGVVEIPVEATGPQVPLECGECHQMTGSQSLFNEVFVRFAPPLF